jgi:hypothetical protein
MTALITARRLYGSDAPIESLWACCGLAVATLGLVAFIYSAIVLQLSARGHPVLLARGLDGGTLQHRQVSRRLRALREGSPTAESTRGLAKVKSE